MQAWIALINQTLNYDFNSNCIQLEITAHSHPLVKLWVFAFSVFITNQKKQMWSFKKTQQSAGIIS